MLDLVGDRVAAEEQVQQARARVKTEREHVGTWEAAAKQLEEEYEVRCCTYLSRTALNIPLVMGKTSVQLL